MAKGSDLFTAADELAQILGPDLAAHFVAHRKALKKPMTQFAGQLMAKKLRTFPDPVAAVEQAILKGWTDVWPVEPPSAPRVNGKPMSPIDARMHQLKEKIENEYGFGREAHGDPKDVEVLRITSRATH